MSKPTESEIVSTLWTLLAMANCFNVDSRGQWDAEIAEANELLDRMGEPNEKGDFCRKREG